MKRITSRDVAPEDSNVEASFNALAEAFSKPGETIKIPNTALIAALEAFNAKSEGVGLRAEQIAVPPYSARKRRVLCRREAVMDLVRRWTEANTPALIFHRARK